MLACGVFAVSILYLFLLFFLLVCLLFALSVLDLIFAVVAALLFLACLEIRGFAVATLGRACLCAGTLQICIQCSATFEVFCTTFLGLFDLVTDPLANPKQFLPPLVFILLPSLVYFVIRSLVLEEDRLRPVLRLLNDEVND